MSSAVHDVLVQARMLVSRLRRPLFGIGPERRSTASPLGERRLLLLALLVVVQVRVVLWLLPSRVSLNLVRRFAEAEGKATLDARPSVALLASCVEAVSRRVPHASCLTQAISAQLLLRRYRYESRLCLGVARSASGEFFAHAWLEHGGRVVIGGAKLDEFTRLPALSSTSHRKSPIGTR